jgi:hypothetical protein
MNTTAKFPLGSVVITTNALNTISDVAPDSTERIFGLLARHRSGDWGNVDNEDKRSNNAALKHGDRILSSYDIEGIKVWVITEHDRSITTVLLPEDY